MYAMQLACSQMLPAVLNAAVELELFEIIADAGSRISTADIASKLPTQNPDAAASMLGRMMDLLTSHSVLTCSVKSEKDGKVEKLYGLAPAGKYSVIKKNQATEGNMAVILKFANHPATKDLL